MAELNGDPGRELEGQYAYFHAVQSVSPPAPVSKSPKDKVQMWRYAPEYVVVIAVRSSQRERSGGNASCSLRMTDYQKLSHGISEETPPKASQHTSVYSSPRCPKASINPSSVRSRSPLAASYPQAGADSRRGARWILSVVRKWNDRDVTGN